MTYHDKYLKYKLNIIGGNNIHTEPVKSVAFSFDNKYYVSGSWDHTIKIWSTETENVIQTLNVWNRYVNGATNIYRIAKNAINGLERPKYLCREKKDENIKVVKPKKEKIKKVIQNKANKSVRVVALTKS